MSQEQFVTIIVLVVTHTAALAWWAATLTYTVKSHEKRITKLEARRILAEENNHG